MSRIVVLLCAVLMPWLVSGADCLKGGSSSDQMEKGVSSGVSIVPMPAQIEESGNRFLLPQTLSIYAKGGRMKRLATTFIDDFTAVQLPRMELAGSPREAFVSLQLDPSLDAEEYLFASSDKGISIKGGSEKGAWWGLQTLGQLLTQAEASTSGFRFAELVIRDKPRYGYRGAHLDCSRHFFTVKEVKQFIDILTLHKINSFHWHLTDDQGWRIEIRSYPELTRVGSYRRETIVGHHYHKHDYDGIPYQGFYTQQQIRDIVAYAAARQITIIPEIEMPGHAQAALACYPWLGCRGKEYEVWPSWGVSKEVFCVGRESTFRFLEKVLDEVCDLFPGEYIHIGGDEAPRDRWKECSHCQERIRQQGLKSEAQLQSYLVNRIEKYLNKKGRRIIGWDEILEGGVTPTATIMSWRGTEGGIAAARQGNDVIMTPCDFFYLDYYQTPDPAANGEALAIGGCVTLEKCYSFDSTVGLDAKDQHYIKGVQANTWTEFMPDFDHVQHMILPRIAAAAEIGWSPRKSEYVDFRERVRRGLLPLYRTRGYRYAGYAF